MKNVSISIWATLIGFAVMAQETTVSEPKKYAQAVIETLASNEYHGRGYINGGDSLAASFIEKEFQINQLKSFGDSYQQPFNFSVNTFPGKISFVLTGKDKNTKKEIRLKSKPGIDMLVGGGNPSIKGEYRTVVFDSTYTVSTEAFERFSKKIKSPETFVIIDD